MNQPARKWATFLLRWGIAVAGIAWVAANMTIRDQVLVLDEHNLPRPAALAVAATENARTFTLNEIDPATGQLRQVNWDRLVNKAERPGQALSVHIGGTIQPRYLRALDLSDDLRRVKRLLVSNDPYGGEGEWITPQQVVGGYVLRVPYPRVEAGLGGMVRTADGSLLLASIFIFPVVFLITSVRWNALLRVLGIVLPQSRTFVLNMVGCFYNTFMPGSTGGDLLKAYYASKHTPHRTHAVLSVLVDRVVGLLALVILGGAMAGYQYAKMHGHDDPVTRACQRVAIGSAAILAAVALGLVVIAWVPLRKAIGFDWLVGKLPLQKHVQHAVQVVRTYRRRPGVLLWATIATFPVHITVVISAIFAGMAFGLPLPATYYFVAVPVIVLSGALPISPQGAGVMEFFAIQLTKQYGVTVSQAFALTMSIRLVQILWNLTGGVFVLKGAYYAPTQQEQAELEAEEAAEAENDARAESAGDSPRIANQPAAH